jgi:shikimate dehydrogenase
MISGHARLTGLLGWPVSHSKSPRLHNHWLGQLGIDGAFLPLPVQPEDLDHVLSALPRMGFIGVNVTVPHKQAVIARLDDIDPLAARIGAVNCITIGPDGRLRGGNSDALGFIANLRDAQPGFSASRGPIVLLGAGGAARAVAVALIEDGAHEIRLLNRTLETAQSLAAELGAPVTALPWHHRHDALAGAALLVNSTSLGMVHQPPLELSLDALPKAALVNDLVYAPLETALLAAARARGNPCADGLGMLLHQARPAFAGWWGVTPPLTEEIRHLMLAP